MMFASLLLSIAQSSSTALPPVDRTSIPAPALVEDEIFKQINDYRVNLGLPRIARSPSLDKVARIHAADLAANRPDLAGGPAGQFCNAHSWSSHGAWKPMCYTADHAQAHLMWSKPSEITKGTYPGNGYEIASSSSAMTVIPAHISVSGWRASAGHNAVMAELGIWKGKNWNAIGIGVAPGYSVVWFGEEPDTAAR